jgi:hypothetical protein
LVSPSSNAILPITNIRYNHLDSLIYGLIFKPGALYFASLNPSNGSINQINSISTSADQFLTGDAGLDEVNGKYYYLRGGASKELITVDIKTGVSNTTSLVADTFLNSTQLVNLKLSTSLNKLVGLLFHSSKLYFSEVNTTTGQISVVNQTFNSYNQFQTGVCAIDDAYGNYYYLRGVGNYQELVC